MNTIYTIKRPVFICQINWRHSDLTAFQLLPSFYCFNKKCYNQ